MSTYRVPPTDLHWRTPTLGVKDPRSLLACTVRYCRETPEQFAEAQIARMVFDAVGRAKAAWDSRLGSAAKDDPAMTPNVTTIYSLRGARLATTRVDGGWAATLHDAPGLRIADWSERGVEARTAYDTRLRPQATYERIDGEAERCVERWHYGEPDHAAINGCGRLLRHEDLAGRLVWDAFALTGGPRHETRWFLRTLETPDWPEEASGSDETLEDKGYATDRRNDATGAIVTQTDAEGHVWSQRYTVSGALKEGVLQLTGGPEARLVQDLDYDAHGRVIRQKAGNVVNAAEYDPAGGQLRRLQTHTTTGTPVQDITYGYDPTGNVLVISDASTAVEHWDNRRTDGVSSYRYNTLDQLIEATGRENASAAWGPDLPDYQPIGNNVTTPYMQSYTYDAGGNLTNMRHSGQHGYSRAFAVSAHSNRALPANEDGSLPDESTIAGEFDASGNLRTLRPNCASLQWNSRNRLERVVQVARPEGTDDAETYIYGDAARVRKVSTRQVAGTTRTSEVRYLPSLELHSDSVTGQAWTVVVIAAGRTSARVLRWRLGRPDGIAQDQVRHALGDHLGSVAVEVDNDGAMIGAEGYYPYGGTSWRLARNAIEADYRTVRYSGKERDATGLYNYGYRYYAPWLGRWINPDPSGEVDGLNLYGFVRGSPIQYADTDGRNLSDRSDGVARDDATRAYDTMFGEGAVWQGLASGGESGLDTISKLSKRNLARLKSEIDTEQQQRLVERFAELAPADYWLTHFSNSDVRDDDGIHLKSLQTLQREHDDPGYEGNSFGGTIPRYGTHDFVFFSLEAGGAAPRKTQSRFGDLRYHATMDQLRDKAAYTHMAVADLMQPNKRELSYERAETVHWLQDETYRDDVDGIRSFKERAGLREDAHADLLFFHEDMLPGLATKIAVDLKAMLSSTAEAVIEWTSRDRPIENIGEVINVFYRPQIAVPGGIRVRRGSFVFQQLG